MFNLEDEFTKWRQGMATAGLKSPELIRELEEHLREEIDRQVRSGIATAEAFQIAVDRLGRPGALKNEFDVIHRPSLGGLLLRHGWKFVVCTVAGLLAAGTIHLLRPAPYISQATLLVRYIIQDASPGSPTDPNGRRVFPDTRGTQSVMNEVAILTSVDLAERVAKAIGPQRILTNVGGADDLGRATTFVQYGLNVSTLVNSSVIRLAFRHPDPAIVQPVLGEVIEQYLKLHVEIARASGSVSHAIPKVSNISSISAPSPAAFDFAAFSSMLVKLVSAGIVTGLAWTAGAIWYAKHAERRQPGIG